MECLDDTHFEAYYIKTLQNQDPSLSDLINYLQTEQLPAQDNKARSLLLTVNDFFMEDGILYCLWTLMGRTKRDTFVQLVVPQGLRLQILQGAHDDVLAGHLGSTKTYDVIRKRFYWPNMFSDVQHYCKSYVDCATKKSPRSGYKANLIPIPVEGPFHRVGVDCLGPLPATASGNRYIVVFTDYFTRWPEALQFPPLMHNKLLSYYLITLLPDTLLLEFC